MGTEGTGQEAIERLIKKRERAILRFRPVGFSEIIKEICGDEGLRGIDKGKKEECAKRLSSTIIKYDRLLERLSLINLNIIKIEGPDSEKAEEYITMSDIRMKKSRVYDKFQSITLNYDGLIDGSLELTELKPIIKTNSHIVTLYLVDNFSKNRSLNVIVMDLLNAYPEEDPIIYQAEHDIAHKDFAQIIDELRDTYDRDMQLVYVSNPIRLLHPMEILEHAVMLRQKRLENKIAEDQVTSSMMCGVPSDEYMKKICPLCLQSGFCRQYEMVKEFKKEGI